MLTVLGWIAGGFGLALGAWLFVIFLDMLGDIGGGMTKKQVREHERTMALLRSRAPRQPPESTEEKP